MEINSQRKPGRPRAIPADKIDEVIAMYESGMGYRSISNELVNRGLYADWSTVRRVIKKYGPEENSRDGLSSNSDTILTRHLPTNPSNTSQACHSGPGNGHLSEAS